MELLGLLAPDFLLSVVLEVLVGHFRSGVEGSPVPDVRRIHKSNTVHWLDDIPSVCALSSYSNHILPVADFAEFAAWLVVHPSLRSVLSAGSDASLSSADCPCSVLLKLIPRGGRPLELVGKCRTGWMQASLKYPTVNPAENDVLYRSPSQLLTGRTDSTLENLLCIRPLYYPTASASGIALSFPSEK